MADRFYCGDALCKASVSLAPGSDAPWPVRCSACGIALYPTDVLARLPPSELEPKRGELMTERGGRRVAVASGDLGDRAQAVAPSPTSDVDRLLAMVDLPGSDIAPPKPQALQGKKPRLALWVGLVALVVVLVAGAVLAMR